MNDRDETGMTLKERPRWKAFLLLSAKAAVLAVVIFFWYRYVRKNWSDLSWSGWELGWRRTALSAILILSGYVLRACLWAPMLHELTGARIPVLRAFRVSAMAWMGRYIPGKVWSVAGKAYLSSSDRAAVPMTGMAVIVEILWFQLGGILVAGVMLLFSGSSFIRGDYQYILAFLLVAGLVACHPGLFFRAANRVLAMLKRPGLERRPRYRVLLPVMAGNMATFLLWAAGFFVLAGGFADVGRGSFPVIAGVFASAWVIGFFMLLVPAGIGVRESVLAFGLGGIMPTDAAVISLVLLSRVLMTLIELLCFLAALLLPLFFRSVPVNDYDTGSSA
jgi:uncharacterized membrane protein YbhN (UPF0104 family)